MRALPRVILPAVTCLVLASGAECHAQGVPSGSTMAPPPHVAPIQQPQAHPVPVPDVPQPPPGIYSSMPPPGLPTYAPTPAVPSGQYSPPPAPSPITNYGPGGITPVPGAPANPPYSTGGITGHP
jgi:hypothetical protein